MAARDEVPAAVMPIAEAANTTAEAVTKVARWTEATSSRLAVMERRLMNCELQSHEIVRTVVQSLSDRLTVDNA